MIAISKCDVWYSIGNPLGDRWLSIPARILGKPRVVHWVGSDLLTLAVRPQLARKLREHNILHLAETTWTADELNHFGLAAGIVPLPPRHHYGESQPLPREFTVMLYVPRTRREFYGADAFEQLMRRLRHVPIRYIVVGGGELESPPGVDVVNLGWRNDLRDAYQNASVLLRFTPHDGLSLMVLEALTYGRHVVWTQPFPYVRSAREYLELEREVVSLYDLHRRGELEPQAEASAFVRKQYSPESCIGALSAAWDSAMQKPLPQVTEPCPVD